MHGRGSAGRARGVTPRPPPPGRARQRQSLAAPAHPPSAHVRAAVTSPRDRPQTLNASPKLRATMTPPTNRPTARSRDWGVVGRGGMRGAVWAGWVWRAGRRVRPRHGHCRCPPGRAPPPPRRSFADYSGCVSHFCATNGGLIRTLRRREFTPSSAQTCQPPGGRPAPHPRAPDAPELERSLPIYSFQVQESG